MKNKWLMVPVVVPVVVLAVFGLLAGCSTDGDDKPGPGPGGNVFEPLPEGFDYPSSDTHTIVPIRGFNAGAFGQPANQKGFAADGWVFDDDGQDGDALDEGWLSIEDLTSAKTLVMVLGRAVTGGFQLVAGTKQTGYETNDSLVRGWISKSIFGDTGTPNADLGTTMSITADGVEVRVELSKAFGEDYADFQSAVEARLVICYYTGGIAALDIKGMYLEVPTTPSTPEE